MDFRFITPNIFNKYIQKLRFFILTNTDIYTTQNASNVFIEQEMFVPFLQAVKPNQQ